LLIYCGFIRIRMFVFLTCYLFISDMCRKYPQVFIHLCIYPIVFLDATHKIIDLLYLLVLALIYIYIIIYFAHISIHVSLLVY